MANTLITPPEIDPQSEARMKNSYAPLHTAAHSDAGPRLGEPDQLRSTNPFQSLIGNLRDAFFPEQLPPLVLESTPIAVADPMEVKRDPKSTGIAVGVHALLFLLVIWISAKAIKVYIAPPKEKPKDISFVEPPPPPPIVRAPVLQRSGGGGGQHDIAPVSKGAPPKFATTQILPPSAPPKITPKLAVPPTLVGDPKMVMKSDLPNIGMTNGLNVGVSMGNGHGSGLGSGNGGGLGSGNGGGTGGGDFRIGVNGVSRPSLIYQTEPEFSEEARKAKFQGEVLVHAVIDANGRPTRLVITRPLGMGLDEKAKEAVMQWRFKPAMKDGHPVPVPLDIAVNFQIF